MGNYFIEQIAKSHKISEYLSTHGVQPRRDSDGKLVYHCPLPGHSNDNTPSFYVYDKGDHEDYYCFGCIEANEPVWSRRGLLPIREIKIGDEVLGLDGKFHRVSDVSRKRKPVVELRLSAFKDPLLLTMDHRCIFLRREDAIRGLPYISVRSDGQGQRSERYSSRSRSLDSYGDCIRFTEAEMKEVRVGDFFAFPVIPASQRNRKNLFSQEAVREYKKGPRSKRLSIPAIPSIAYFCGLYLAEGSISGRTLRLTMALDEVSILRRMQYTLLNDLGLQSSVFEIPEKNVSELVCSSVTLIDQMVHFFGKGCGGKKIPAEILSWTPDLQRSVLQGYLDGDGNESHRSSISVSREMTYGLFALSVQSGGLPCVSDKRIPKQRDGSIRKDQWIITYRKRQGLNAFYENVGNTTYFFSRVDSIGESGADVDVIDLTVPETESFVTKLGVVHNCKSGGGIVQLVAAMEQISLKDAISKLSHGLGIDMSDVIDHLVREIILVTNGEDNSAETVLQMVMYISTVCHDYLRRVNFDPVEVEVCDKLHVLCDNLMKSRDRKGIQQIIDLLPMHLGRRYDAWAEKKEREERESITAWQV